MTDETNAPGTDLGVTEPDPAPAPEPTPDPRVLTDTESDAYTARLASVGFTFTPAGIGPDCVGFDVRADDGSACYGYRFEVGDTAISLMDRVCAERGC